MADSQVPRLELPFFRTDLGRSVARRSWQKLMRKEIRSEVDSGQTRSYRRHSNDTLRASQSTADAAPSKAEGAEKDVDLSSGYSRGEAQKPVSKAYKENWNLIFAKKRKR